MSNVALLIIAQAGPDSTNDLLVTLLYTTQRDGVVAATAQPWAWAHLALCLELKMQGGRGRCGPCPGGSLSSQ